MASDFILKRGDRLPKLRATLQQGAPASPIDFTAAASVKLILKQLTAPTTVVTGTCASVVATAGITEYAWGASDTLVSGTYNGEFEIDWGTGIKETVPNDTYFTLTIVDDLG
jgi:hypothetical protein